MSANTAPGFIIGDGKVTTAVGTVGAGEDVGRSVALQPDGKIVVAGNIYNGSIQAFAVLRYNADGSLDTSFGTDGKVVTNVTASDVGSSVVLQPDGKILVAGFSYSNGFALVRYNADGSLDASFDTDGKVTTAIGTTDFGYRVALQPDGKILVAGTSNGDFALVRYNANGSLDTSFDTDGKVTTDFGASDNGFSLVLQPDGKIVVAGSGNDDFALARYNANGSLDTSFDADGKVTTNISAIDVGFSVALQPDGKILVAGYDGVPGSSAAIVLVRYNANGSLDTTFDTDGKVTTGFGAGFDHGYGIALQPDGKILVSGTSYNGSTQAFALVRYNADGSLDTGFGTNGKLTTAIGSVSDEGHSVALRPDGRIVVAGFSYNGSNYDFALARYNADGSLDPSLGGANALNGAPSFTGGGFAVGLDFDVQVYDAELSAAGSYAGASLTLARHGGANSQDMFSALSVGSLGALVQGGSLIVGGTNIGTVSVNGGGTLLLTFNNGATQSLVNAALGQIAYGNTSKAAPVSVQIDWTFSDGNSGAQGTGGALQATGSTTAFYTPTFLTGTAGNDILTGIPGYNIINGGSGFDTEVNGGAFRQYKLTGNPVNTATLAGPEGTDSLAGIEKVSFLDGAMVFDPASHIAQATRLYLATLDRLPDALGLNFHSARLDGGLALALDANDFVNSPEFQAIYGALNNTQFVNQLYLNVLNRPADSAGLAFHKGRLDSGISRGEVVTNFSESPEFINNNAALFNAGLWDIDETAASVARLYLGTLGRAAEVAGLSYHEGILKAGVVTLVQDATNFTASPEFQAKYGALDNTQFVNQLYQNVLGRAGDAGGVASHINDLVKGMSRGEVTLGFTESPEYQLKTIGQIDHGIHAVDAHFP